MRSGEIEGAGASELIVTPVGRGGSSRFHIGSPPCAPCVWSEAVRGSNAGATQERRATDENSTSARAVRVTSVNERDSRHRTNRQPDTSSCVHSPVGVYNSARVHIGSGGCRRTTLPCAYWTTRRYGTS